MATFECETKLCKKCGNHYPLTQIFRWDAKHMKKGINYHDNRICIICYNELQSLKREEDEYSYR